MEIFQCLAKGNLLPSMISRETGNETGCSRLLKILKGVSSFEGGPGAYVVSDIKDMLGHPIASTRSPYLP
jgi:hypothetical protein